MQYRLSTLLVAFVVVWASLAVFGVAGLGAAAFLLVIAVFYRSPELRPARPGLLFIPLAVFVLIALLLPVVQSAREAERHAECTYNLRTIGIQLYNYEAGQGRFPPAALADNHGKATHSWRTLLLPYYHCSYLCNACDLREPWNSPKNSGAAAQVLPFFCCPSDPSTIGRPTTSYLAVTGPGTAWDDQRFRLTPPRAIVVEVADSKIPWAEPHDLTLDEACRNVSDASGQRIFGRHFNSGGFFLQDEAIANVLFSDGSVRAIPVGLPPEILRGLFTGDQAAWKACEENFATVRHRRIHWTNCTALAVLILSYAVLLFRPRDKRPPPAEPAIPPAPAAAGDSGSGG